jgi:hypothetical protein
MGRPSEPMNRKDLIREYKKSRRPMGVFRVRNTVADRSFIGTSSDLPAMLNRQRAQLRFCGHPNKELQKDFNELGEEAFVFEILDTLTPSDDPAWDPASDLRVLGELWLQKLSPFPPAGYNPAPPETGQESGSASRPT